MVKYVDGVVKKEENGKFKRNPHGQPASPERPGYSNEFYKKVGCKFLEECDFNLKNTIYKENLYKCP